MVLFNHFYGGILWQEEMVKGQMVMVHKQEEA